MKRKFIKKNDIIIAAVILALCAAAAPFMLKKSDDLVAEVSVNGNVIESAALSTVKEDIEIRTDTVPSTLVVISPDGIRFESSECENQLCVKSGKLTRKGAAAVCLPARVVITLKGENGVDAITY